MKRGLTILKDIDSTLIVSWYLQIVSFLGHFAWTPVPVFIQDLQALRYTSPQKKLFMLRAHCLV